MRPASSEDLRGLLNASLDRLFSSGRAPLIKTLPSVLYVRRMLTVSYEMYPLSSGLRVMETRESSIEI